MPDGRLWLLRDTYAAETAWAPRHVGKELRLARLGAFNADLGRHPRRTPKPTPPARPATTTAPRGTRPWPPATGPCATATGSKRHTFAPTMDDRQEWEHATEHSRHLAIAADAELRRRHPDQRIEPLRSAEPAPVSDTDRAELTWPRTRRSPRWPPGSATLPHKRQAFREKLEELQGLKVPSEDPDWDDLGDAFPSWKPPGRDAILQPPKPQITPSAKILQLAAERDTEPEAAD